MDPILIVVITYNNEGVIDRCLTSVGRQTYRNFELLLIDNKSTDRTLSVISAHLAAHRDLKRKTTVIQKKGNTGFAKSVNTGLRYAMDKGYFVAVQLFNPDISVGRDVVAKGAHLLRTYPDIGACCPKILYPDKKIWWIGTRLFSDRDLLFGSRFGLAEHKDKGSVYRPAGKTLYSEVDALTGCAMLIRLSAVKKVGIFNEKYYMYMEDIDYSVRLKKAGYRTVFFPGATVIHNTEDKRINIKSNAGMNIRKYRIYLTSAFLYLLEHKPVLSMVWLCKLPYALFVTYKARKL